MRKLLVMVALACMAIFNGAAQAQQTLQGYAPELGTHLLTKPVHLFALPLSAQYLESEHDDLPEGIHFQLRENRQMTPPYLRFYVASDGSFCFLDSTPCGWYLKQFDRAGRLRRAIPFGPGGAHRDDFVVVDKEGRTYIGLQVLNREGKLLKERTRRLVEGWERARTMASDRDRRLLQLADPLLVDQTGAVHYRSGAAHVKVNPETGSTLFLPHFCFPLKDGSCYAVEPLLPPFEETEAYIVRCYDQYGRLLSEGYEHAAPRRTITVYGADGTVQRRFSVPRGQRSEVEKLFANPFLPIGVDAKGHFYACGWPAVSRRIPVSPDGKIALPGYNVVAEYDEKGEFVGVRALVPRELAEPVVGEDGTVYWLEAEIRQDGRQYLHVMMAPPPGSQR